MRILTQSGPVEVALLRWSDKVVILLSDPTDDDEGVVRACQAIDELTKDVIQPMLAWSSRLVFFHRSGRSGHSWSHIRPVRVEGSVRSLKWEALDSGDARHKLAVRAELEVAARRDMGRVLGPLLAGNSEREGLDEPPWKTA